MADEWWNSARTGGDDTSACSTAPATESAASSSTSMNFQPDLPDTAVAASSSFLDDPHMDWTQAYMRGKAAAGEATSFNALLQLQGAASHHFLLDGEEPLAPAPYVDGTVVAASQAGVSLYADNNQYASSGSGYAFSQLLKSSAPSAQHHQHQQFPGFFSSSGHFGPAPEPPQLLLQAVEPKPVKDLKVQSNTEPVQDACSSVTRSVPDSPEAVKKPRIATPSPLPTFKVRKEKLGDRITALQQLVSPFGKTDTASVLHEAIEYIKFLHDQVASLSSPYLRCRRPVQLQHQQARDGGEEQQDLRSRGLCLVPVSSYTVASETAPEFWHPTIGGTFQ